MSNREMVLLAALLVVAVAPRGTDRSSDPFPSTAAHLLARHNLARQVRGLGMLHIDDNLTGRAAEWAQSMARAGALRHSSLPYAENIAAGQPDADSAFNAWMESAGHRANILNPRCTRMGAGFGRSPRGTPYWCVLLD